MSKTITQLADGGALRPTDYVEISRAGVSYKALASGILVPSSIQVESGAGGKISTFPDASTNMGPSDRVTGLQGGANVNFSPAQLPGGLLQSFTKNLSAAELNHLHSAPPVIVPAPGNGLAIYPVFYYLAYTFNTVDFNLPGGIDPYYANDLALPTSSFNAPWDGIGASGVDFTTQSGTKRTSAQINNQGLVIYDPTGDSSTTGDGTGSITTWYVVKPIP